ncbi:MAG: NAD(P) transhydrogenase subunit beta [Limisphaerales bacterium]|jgi:NAD(P) transhydrogenase subunit beta
MDSTLLFLDISSGNFALQLIYLFGSITFILGLKMLSSPDSARKGNLLAAAGMGLAIFGTIFLHRQQIEGHAGEYKYVGNYVWIFGGLAIGTIIGWLMAVKVKMTAMPQMVSFFNGMGGACAALIGLIEYRSALTHGYEMSTGFLIIVYLGVLIGAVSFAGSMIAYGKLEGKINDFGGRAMQIFNILFLALITALIVQGISNPGAIEAMPWIVFAAALLYGVLFVFPIGGADMPVVISLLNSFTGIAAALGGFLYDNQVMLTGGILVGSAGTILTILMCKAMNRSLMNVIIGSFGGGGAGASSGSGEQAVKEITATDAAILCAYATRVCIVPGYGLAVAQAQHTCHEFERQLEEKGVSVTYAIHPVAGRMPGHMNVLLAEADVSYPKMLEMDDANPQMPNTDVVIVVGANDVVNPAAEKDPSSPIYGMPIINVDKATNVIVMKRSMGKGYAGIENELFFAKNTRMLFGDAKASLENLVSEIKSL